jgi:hypothetical protein
MAEARGLQPRSKVICASRRALPTAKQSKQLPVRSSKVRLLIAVDGRKPSGAGPVLGSIRSSLTHLDDATQCGSGEPQTREDVGDSVPRAGNRACAVRRGYAAGLLSSVPSWGCPNLHSVPHDAGNVRRARRQPDTRRVVGARHAQPPGRFARDDAPNYAIPNEGGISRCPCVCVQG